MNDLSNMPARSNTKVSVRTEPRAHWQFVNISSPLQSQDAHFKKLVRGNAMRSHRRNQKRNRVRTFSKAMLPVRDSPPKREDDQLPKVAPQESTTDDRYDAVVSADRNWWKRDLDLLWEVLEAELPWKGAHETASRTTSTTDTTPTPSCTEYAVVKSNRRWYNRSSGNPIPVNYLQTYVDTGVSDPFGTYPSSRHSQRQRLIHHCKYLVCCMWN